MRKSQAALLIYLNSSYVSGAKTVQTLASVSTIAHRPKHCAEPDCKRHQVTCKSARWQQIAPSRCTYGYDVIALIGWQRQTYHTQFQEIDSTLQARLQISESQVRHLYHYRYLPLLACHERQYLEDLKAMAAQCGLLLGLDGLAPEGGEPQLWVVRELQTGLTLRSGWMSQQDQTAFENFLLPIRELDLPIAAVISDKQRGLVPAVATVFPDAKHAFCQMHYLKNAAEPVAEADQTMAVLVNSAKRRLGFPPHSNANPRPYAGEFLGRDLDGHRVHLATGIAADRQRPRDVWDILESPVAGAVGRGLKRFTWLRGKTIEVEAVVPVGPADQRQAAFGRLGVERLQRIQVRSELFPFAVVVESVDRILVDRAVPIVIRGRRRQAVAQGVG